ncbi:MAG: putative disulfide formation protein [Microgenomates group bacterium GW2011_GWC1_49_7]|nr:MAG: putative disulfide formation protein [Microgenomates group bacterium GW2011_GWC1_49_7]
MLKLLDKYALLGAWSISLSATLGSLFFSEILRLPPCVLCWYQRILMYPLVLILGVGIVKKDKYLPFYVLPLSILGTVVAFYHYLLQRGVIPDSVAPCSFGISCTSRYIEYFGLTGDPVYDHIYKQLSCERSLRR